MILVVSRIAIGPKGEGYCEIFLLHKISCRCTWLDECISALLLIVLEIETTDSKFSFHTTLT